MLKKTLAALYILCGVGIDQLSKLLVMQKLTLHQLVPIIDAKLVGLNLFLTYNTGAAFGFLNQASGWQNNLFLFIAIGIIIGIIYLFLTNVINKNIEKLAFILILSGAIGNLIDRIRYKQVIDFIDCYLQLGAKTMHWFTFNIADSLICIGVGLLIYTSLCEMPFHHAAKK